MSTFYYTMTANYCLNCLFGLPWVRALSATPWALLICSAFLPGRENMFLVPAHIIQKMLPPSALLENVPISRVLEALLTPYNSLPEDLTQRVAWIVNQEKEMVMFPPCTLFLEWLLEDTVTRAGCYGTTVGPGHRYRISRLTFL